LPVLELANIYSVFLVAIMVSIMASAVFFKIVVTINSFFMQPFHTPALADLGSARLP